MKRQYDLVLYHGNCYDGFGAAFAAWTVLGESASYTAVNYGQAPPNVSGRRALIADFSFPRDVLIKMRSEAAILHVLDHHKTAEADLAGLDFCEFDMDRSGAVMAWQHFHADPVPSFFLYLQDRDLWRFNLSQSREVSYALRAYPFDFSVWSDLVDDVGRLATEGVVIARLNAINIETICLNARMLTLGGVTMPVVNTSLLFSECADFLLKQSVSGVAGYYFDRADKRQWGLRSRKDIDCSVIAKHYGGGGHAQASGFVTDIGWLP